MSRYTIGDRHAGRRASAEDGHYSRSSREGREGISAHLSEVRGPTLLRPYDAPEVIADHGILGLSRADQLSEDPDRNLLVYRAGGGSPSGIALAH